LGYCAISWFMLLLSISQKVSKNADTWVVRNACQEHMDPNRESGAPEGADQADEARIREKIKDLVPRYLADIRKDTVLFPALLEASDFERIRGIGHVLKGTGSTFGFPELTYWGAAIEESARRSDLPKLREQTAAVLAFLARLD
jgi:HPt (histidine-containing phosphotransfer) domain-containing protein